MFTEEKNPWTTLSSEEKYDNPWINVTEHQVINPSGNPGIYGKISFKNIAVGVIPLDEEYNTYLVGQYRYALNRYSWEIPEGGSSVGTPPMEGAKRELLEETGLKAKSWVPALNIHMSNSVTDELGLIYVAKGLSQHEAEPEDTEDLQIKKVPFDKVFEMVIKGEITDALAVAGIFKVKYMIDKGLV